VGVGGRLLSGEGFSQKTETSKVQRDKEEGYSQIYYKETLPSRGVWGRKGLLGEGG